MHASNLQLCPDLALPSPCFAAHFAVALLVVAQLVVAQLVVALLAVALFAVALFAVALFAVALFAVVPIERRVLLAPSLRACSR
jgi:hypothetical protein